MARNRIEIGLLAEAAKGISQSLADCQIPHVVLGGVAVYLHGVERSDADDIDFFIGKATGTSVFTVIENLGYKSSGKYYERDGIKIQIKSEGFPSFPNPEDASEWQCIDGVRVPTIDKVIQAKAEVCRDILDKVLSKGVGGPRRRSSLIKHATDLVGLIRVYAEKKNGPTSRANSHQPSR